MKHRLPALLISLPLASLMPGWASVCRAESAHELAPADEVTLPKFLGGKSAVYPQGQEREAEVRLKLLIRRDGSVESAEVISGAEPFSSAAAEAALGFIFEPARRGETPVASYIHFDLTFRPPAQEASDLVSSRPVGPEASKEQTIEVSVVGARKTISTRTVSDAETQIIPGAEGDPIRALQALPGPVPILMSGPFIGIRGAPPGLVGSSFDDIELPYLFHLARGAAVVHPWLVDSASVYAAGRPGNLGRSIGGQVEATSAAPSGRARASGRLRLTEAALGAEVPFAEGRGSVLMAGRYSYTAPLVSMIAPDFALDYWDYQGRVRYALNPTDTLELISLGAHDMSGRRTTGGDLEEIFDATFHRAALRFSRQETSGYAMRFGITYGHDEWDANQSQLRPWSDILRAQASWKVPIDAHHHISLGADTGLRSQHDAFFSAEGATTSFRRIDSDSAAWVTWSYRASQGVELDLGVRADWFSSGDSPLADKAFFASAGPHLLFSYELSRFARLHTSLAYGGARPSPGQRPPSRTYSVAGGLAQGLLSDVGVEFNWPRVFRVDVSVYQNAFFNTADVNTLLNLVDQDPTIFSAPGLVRGQGQSYGFEVSVRRTFAGRFNCFVSYSLGRSWRSVGRVQGPSEFDRRHVFDASLGYDLGRGWLISARGSYLSGYPARTSTVALADDPPRTTPYYQIDAQIARRFRFDDHRSLGITIGILNATLNEETNDMFCNGNTCKESRVGPATIPTIGIDGEI